MKDLIEAAKEYGLDPKTDIESMFVGRYAEQDPKSTLKLWQIKIEM